MMVPTISQPVAARDSLGFNKSTYFGLSRAIARRFAPCAVVTIVFLVMNAVRSWYAAKLGNESFFTGYSLAAIVACLLLLGVRKRVANHAWGKVAIWQRAHHYMGMLSIVAYALHANFITTGWLESLLAISYWLIALSGILSWYINKSAPRLLMAAGPQILRQDIPDASGSLARQAYAIAVEAAGRSDSAVLADHYRHHMSNYFASSRSILFRIRPTGNTRRQLLAELENLDRYMDQAGCALRQQMSQLVQAKDNLDFQSAIQNRIRLCASMHTWLLGGFTILAVAHVLLAHQYSSSW
jgi:hypothetical protein